MIIYIVTNDINNKVYIGQTTKTLENRIAQHRNAFVSQPNTHLYIAMHKYGWDKFHFRVIDSSAKSKAELDELEKYYIALYDSVHNGYNMTEGGESNPMDCEVSRNKHDSIMRSTEVRAKISESMKASYAKRGGPSADHRKHLSDQKKELYSSSKGDAVKAKFRSSFVLTPEHQSALIQGRRKGVYCINESGSVVARFKTVKEGAQWWLKNGYPVKSYDQLCDRIKESYTQDRFLKGVKWLYEDPQAGHRA